MAILALPDTRLRPRGHGRGRRKKPLWRRPSHLDSAGDSGAVSGRRRFLDRLAAYPPANDAEREVASRAQAQLQRHLREDATYWQGWWQRHDYTLTFLGDDVAGESGDGAVVPQSVLVILFLALMGALLREMRRQMRPAPPRRLPQRPPPAVPADDARQVRRPFPMPAEPSAPNVSAEFRPDGLN